MNLSDESAENLIKVAIAIAIIVLVVKWLW